MKYEKIKKGKLIERENRFIALVDVEGEVDRVHVPNTGRCKEIFVPGAVVILNEPTGTKRKTRYSLVSAYKGDLLINIDSQAPNKIVKAALENKKIFKDITLIHPEYTYGNSRFDFYFERGKEKAFMEVKGVTLEDNGICMFPDAPTLRGVKHIEELIKAKGEGYGAYIMFLVQMEGMKAFVPNVKMHKDLGDALKDAMAAGVNVLVYDTIVREGEVIFGKKVELMKW